MDKPELFDEFVFDIFYYREDFSSHEKVQKASFTEIYPKHKLKMSCLVHIFGEKSLGFRYSSYINDAVFQCMRTLN